MIIRKLRLQRGWSQEQLSQLSGLSIRTIQRIEQGQKAGLESLKSLAAVFEIQVSDLQMEPPMNKEITITEDEKQAIEYVKSIKEFYSHLVTYLLVITGLFVINYFTSPDYWWAVWPALGWGIGIVSHALSAFEILNIFGPEWERKQVEKRLGRKL
ncbi:MULTISPECIES: 2TM domain-containing protein [Photobacterium]|uniref:HTH cro/C1-type domain-containing protein n=2 Tax=Photobacterium leiognathi TaxID=553611 RepID=V5F6A7_PHOLE|nr:MULTISPECIES: 2TM domain-containing protein [Photobacterium]MBP2701942.1 Pr2TM family membrane protein [Vibrio parahaemolyticus]KJF89530.1 XRE family transcriptional regulator [Photobacterium leiognathi]KJF96879.1 XRE family transcriptional regulator [Photobacterium leiognathi]KPA51551.1 XRE family transcriptional regulator [Photobacterium leiognathi subsp. mandapamensis]MZG57003.1 helix-turn-helix domain-containing protein [Photobacterium lucens]